MTYSLVNGPAWREVAAHRHWLRRAEDDLLVFHERHILSDGVGFPALDARGNPERESIRHLYAVTRYVHCFALEHLRGRPGADTIVRAGLELLSRCFADAPHGGWIASISADGRVIDDTKSSYGHAFVLLAASSAVQAGLAPSSFVDEAAEVIDSRLWRADEGAVVEATTVDWDVLEPEYRGQNANMHLMEASLAAFEATGDEAHLRRAESISEVVIARNIEVFEGRIPEHFDARWHVRPEYNLDRPDDPFRPPGALIGHSFEWARLLIGLNALSPDRARWAQDAAVRLFDRAITDGVQETGAAIYSVDLDGNPLDRRRLHWVLAEGVGAAAALSVVTSDDRYEGWYRRFWSFLASHHFDRDSGGWWHELDEEGRPSGGTWAGKPDLYHALQATLFARSDARFGLVEAARRGRQA